MKPQLRPVLFCVIAALIVSTSVQAYTENRTTLEANASMRWSPFSFASGASVLVAVNGDGTTNLAVTVFDRDGKVVTGNFGPRPSMTFTAAPGQYYLIEVQNQGNQRNDIVIRTY